MMRRLLCVLPLLFLLACDTDEDFTPTPPSGPSIPTIGGTYSSATMWRFDFTSATEQEVITCAGGVTIATQIGTNFSGTFFIVDNNCPNLGGTVTGGTLDPTTGAVSFELTSSGFNSNFITAAFGCTYVSGDRGVTGTLIGNELDVRARTVMDCGADGQATVDLHLAGTR